MTPSLTGLVAVCRNRDDILWKRSKAAKTQSTCLHTSPIMDHIEPGVIRTRAEEEPIACGQLEKLTMTS